MADLEETLHPFVDSGDIPGLVALVARGEDVEVVALGTRDSSGTPMGRDSLFRGASITKPVTAALAMALVEDGRIDLDAPVADLLPELAEPQVLRTLESPLDDTVACERPITARHLLTGTAGHGFCTWESAVTPLLMERLHQAADDIHEVPAPDEWMRRLATIPLMHQPGDGWTYNASYDVLGVLLARAAGQDLADVMAERLLDPLGMADTGFHVPAGKVDRLTTMYGAGDGGLVVRDEPDGFFTRPPAFPSGSGGLVTTADDWLCLRADAARRGRRRAERGVGAPDDDRPHDAATAGDGRLLPRRPGVGVRWWCRHRADRPVERGRPLRVGRRHRHVGVRPSRRDRGHPPDAGRARLARRRGPAEGVLDGDSTPRWTVVPTMSLTTVDA